MITASDQIFRITYEAFSKFSNNLNRCRTFGEIAECLTVHLKYLFNYHVFRASYHRNHQYVHLVSTALNTELVVQDSPELLGYEELLFEKKIPMRWTDPGSLCLPEPFKVAADEQAVLWGWNFFNEERQIVVSLLSGSSRKFSEKDINFVKLVADNLETKLLEFCLMKELDKKNSIISQINDDQTEIIKQRTREIEEKNKTLLKISVLNAHNVREPLSRILGLVNLLGADQTLESMQEILPMLMTSSKDLDRALQDVIDRATAYLTQLEA